jgi:dipeptidyl aminopeptidase/acylaminoacyl peptidase
VWVMLPNGADPVPVLLNIHGGPAGQYGWGFFDEFQVYASAGYGVVACNPRGSSGRGRDFVEAVTGDGWGVVDVADVMAALDGALARHPRLDPGRLGIMGGSYGGFLTAWITAREIGSVRPSWSGP